MIGIEIKTIIVIVKAKIKVIAIVKVIVPTIILVKEIVIEIATVTIIYSFFLFSRRLIFPFCVGSADLLDDDANPDPAVVQVRQKS